jgi:hypothetical protein
VDRAHDVGTHVAVAALQGASNFRVVRVTDSTDTAASHTLASGILSGASAFWTAVAAAINAGSGVSRGESLLVTFDATAGTFTARYTGTVGATITVSVSQGAKAGTSRVVVNRPGYRGELFDNIPYATGAAPSPAIYALTGGSDGAIGVTTATLIGSSSAPYTGMYTLEGQGCAVIDLVDGTDCSEWTTAAAWGYGQGVVFGFAGPNGETLSSASANLLSAGLDDYDVNVLLGDYLYWNDDTNNVVRLVSPVALWAGKRVALAPNNSTMNKPLYGIAGSQKSGLVGTGTLTAYTSSEILAIELARLDVIANPSPGGSYWAVQVGHTTSSNAANWNEQYVMLTFYFAKSLNAALGRFVGEPITPTLMQNARATQLSLLSVAKSAGLIGTIDGTPAYSVVCDASNNPRTQTGLGFLKSAARIAYQGIVEQFLVDLEGGATVTIQSSGANAP